MDYFIFIFWMVIWRFETAVRYLKNTVQLICNFYSNVCNLFLYLITAYSVKCLLYWKYLIAPCHCFKLICVKYKYLRPKKMNVLSIISYTFLIFSLIKFLFQGIKIKFKITGNEVHNNNPDCNNCSPSNQPCALVSVL